MRLPRGEHGPHRGELTMGPPWLGAEGMRCHCQDQSGGMVSRPGQYQSLSNRDQDPGVPSRPHTTQWTTAELSEQQSSA